MCFVHVRRNLKVKLAEYNIPVNLLQKILGDVFGKKFGTVLVEGIVDASGDCNFQNKLAVTQACRSCSLQSTANLERSNSTNDAIVPAPGLTANLPKGRGHKGATAPWSQKPSQPVGSK